MRRRTFVAAGLAAGASVGVAQAQTTAPATPATASPAATPPVQRPIEPTNALEYAFVQALHDERMRDIFRRYMMDTHVAMATTASGEPREVEVHNQDGSITRCVAIFTSAGRVDAVLGERAPRVMIGGRAAFERATGKNVVINYRLIPMLTLEPADVAGYLQQAPGAASAGPTE